MELLSRIIYLSIDNILYSMKTPVYWFVVFIVFLQYKNIGKMEKEILGRYKKSPFLNTLISMYYGLMGGILGSIIFIYFDVSVNQKDLIFIFPLAIILSIINPRFICFSYAGGIISLISLIFKWPQINITGIMYIVGVLHLVESILILIDGINSKMPVFIEKKGLITGGFTMNRFWPVPFTIFIDNGFKFPVAILAILAYGDFSLSRDPVEKSRRASGLLFIFSIILILLAKMTETSIVYKYIVAIFSPLAHEVIIMIGRQSEKDDQYIYMPSKEGLKVLDVLANSIGAKLDINSGDIIIAINGKRIFTKEDIEKVLFYKPTNLLIDIFNIDKGYVSKKYDIGKKAIDTLGIIPVPHIFDSTFELEEKDSLGERLIKQYKKRTSTFRN